MSDSLGRQYGRLYLSGRSDRVNQLAHVSLVDGKGNAYLGLYAGAQRPLAGGNNTYVGSYAGANASAEASVFLGLGSGRRATRIRETCFIGYKAGELSERVEASVCVGAFAGRKMTRANCNAVFGYQAAAELTSGSRNTIIGTYAAYQQFSASDNVVVGHRAGYKNRIGANNCYLGTNSGFAAYNGMENVCVGVRSGEELYAGQKNVLLGYAAGSKIADASNCIAIGTGAMQFFNLGDTNTCLGTETARYFSGNNNTILGGYSVGNATGSNNSVIGSNSMNRRNSGRVEINGCVVLGENVVFDVPVKRATYTYADATVDSLGTPDPNATVVALTNSDVFDPQTYPVLYLVDTAPVGDPLLPDEYRTEIRGAFAVVEFDTYSVGWGMQVTGIPNYQVLYKPYELVYTLIDSTLTLFVDGASVGSVSNVNTVSIDEVLDVAIVQTSDPPALTVQYRAGYEAAYEEFSADPEIVLPGTFLELAQEDALVDSESVVTVELVSPHNMPPGGEVTIHQSSVPALNAKWVLTGVPTLNSFTIDAGGAVDPGGAVVLGAQTRVFISRARDVTDVTFSIADATATMTGPHGLLEGQTFYLADSEADGVYTVAQAEGNSVTFALPVVVESLGANAHALIALLEPTHSYVEFSATGSAKTVTNMTVTINQRADAEFVTNEIVGPSLSDGHTHVGPAGSLQLMNANIRNKQLEFSDDGLSFARYAIGSLNTLLEARGTFKLDQTASIDFGFEWLASQKLSCVLADEELSLVLSNGFTTNVMTLAEISYANVSTTNGNISGNSLPMDLANVFATDEQWATLSLREDIATDVSQITFSVHVHGGPAGWYEARAAPDITEYVTVNLSDTASPDPNGASFRYYANAFTILKDVSIYNERFRDTPVFSNVIYLGSDHVIDQEADRQDVWITSLGDTRVLRANVDEFRVFPNTMHVMGGAVVAGDLVSRNVMQVCVSRGVGAVSDLPALAVDVAWPALQLDDHAPIILEIVQTVSEEGGAFTSNTSTVHVNTMDDDPSSPVATPYYGASIGSLGATPTLSGARAAANVLTLVSQPGYATLGGKRAHTLSARVLSTAVGTVSLTSSA